MDRTGFWLVIGASILWGTTGTAQALAPPEAQPVMIGTLRLAIAGLGLLAVAWARGFPGIRGRWPLIPTVVAGLCMASYHLLFFAALRRTGVAVGTIVGIGSSPILAGVVAYLVRGEKPGQAWGGATLLAIVGCALLIGAGSRLTVDGLGIFMALGAGLAYAIFTVAGKRMLENIAPELVTASAFSVGALFMFPLLFTADLSWLFELRGALSVLHLGLVTGALAYTIFAYGLQLVPVATAATLTLGEPLTAGLLGIFFLGEQLTPLAFLGIGLIFAGLAWLSLAGQAGRVFGRKGQRLDPERH